MTPRAQEIFNLAKELERPRLNVIELGTPAEIPWREVAKRLARALASMERNISPGFIREQLKLDAFFRRNQDDDH